MTFGQGADASTERENHGAHLAADLGSSKCSVKGSSYRGYRTGSAPRPLVFSGDGYPRELVISVRVSWLPALCSHWARSAKGDEQFLA